MTASTLGIPLSSVNVVPTSSFTNPNGATTGGSITSELNCLVNRKIVLKCFKYYLFIGCTQSLSRIKIKTR